MFKTINPYTQEKIASYTSFEDSDIKSSLQLAEKAYKHWRKTAIDKRAEVIRRAADLLRNQTDAYAHWAALEMGKPISQARAEVEKCAWLCEYFADNSERFLKEGIRTAEDLNARIRYLPHGAVLGIMPWNYPYWQAFRYAIPNIMAGNVAMLKPASNVTRCGLEIENLLQEAGAPEGVFQTVLIKEEDTEKILKERIICGMALTGSGRAGAAVSSLASKHLKKSVLELGGSDAFIVLEDADVKKAAEIAVQSRFTNNGQTCIASKRWIVVKSVADEFTQIVERGIKKLRIGDPLDEETTISCMARPDLVEGLQKQVQKTIEAGVETLIRGGRQENANTYLPTLLTNIPENSPAYREELFGPVACLFVVPDENAAIELANTSDFGLGAAVWSQDVDRALQVSAQLEAGAIAINGMVSSDPRLPFGGVKDSGFGREMGEMGIKEFLNVQAVKISKT